MLVVLTAWPVLNLLWMSLNTIEFSRAGATFTFTPAENFRRLAGDDLFRISLWVTLLFVIASVTIEMVLGFFARARRLRASAAARG